MTTESTDVEEAEAEGAAYSGMLPLNVEKYREYVDDFDISEERKIELLQTLWKITHTFVLLGFGVDDVKRCIPALAEFSFDEESDEVEEENSVQRFNDAAQGKDD